MNLTWEVRDGILKHTGPEEPETQEGKIVRIVDRVAYINHDIDDSIRFGILAPEDLPKDEIALLGDTGARRIDTLVHDLVEASAAPATSRRATRWGRRCCLSGRSCSSACTWARRTRGEHERARTAIVAIFAALADRGDEPQAIVEYIAGMTDRFALEFVEQL